MISEQRITNEFCIIGILAILGIYNTYSRMNNDWWMYINKYNMSEQRYVYHHIVVLYKLCTLYYIILYNGRYDGLILL